MFTDYLIIDSRNYPNWTLIKLSKLLINGRTKFAKFINMDLDYPGSFKWTESQTIGNKMKGYEGNIFVLVDYNTMSQSEYTVMAFQQHQNTVVLGGQTAGADGNISETPLPFGIKSFFLDWECFILTKLQHSKLGLKEIMNSCKIATIFRGKI
jgi:carboxyl-terminal processing protease